MRAKDEEWSPRERFQDTIPYYFSSPARERGENLRVGDFVRLSGLDDKFEVVGICRRRNSVRVRAIDRTDQMYLPMYHVRPWKVEVAE